MSNTDRQIWRVPDRHFQAPALRRYGRTFRDSRLSSWCNPSRRSVADGSGDRDAWSSGAMSEQAGASRMQDGLQSEQANLQVEQARMMLG